MKFLLILSLIIVIVESKCSVGDFVKCCNDMEMFHQCNNAQQHIYNYVDRASSINSTCNLRIYTPELYCDENIPCCTGKLTLCQNINSYDKCLLAETKLNTFIEKASSCINLTIYKPTFHCKKDKDISDYYESSSNILESAISLVLFVISLMVL